MLSAAITLCANLQTKGTAVIAYLIDVQLLIIVTLSVCHFAEIVYKRSQRSK